MTDRPFGEVIKDVTAQFNNLAAQMGKTIGDVSKVFKPLPVQERYWEYKPPESNRNWIDSGSLNDYDPRLVSEFNKLITKSPLAGSIDGIALTPLQKLDKAITLWVTPALEVLRPVPSVTLSYTTDEEGEKLQEKLHDWINNYSNHTVPLVETAVTDAPGQIENFRLDTSAADVVPGSVVHGRKLRGYA